MPRPALFNKDFKNAARLASELSGDPNTQVGAVIVQSNVAVAYGWNSLPDSVKIVSSRFQKPVKHHWFVHAEENAICTAARYGRSTNGSDIYVTHRPCAYCARKIIQAGIRRVFVDGAGFSKFSITHGSHQTEIMFKEAGVEMFVV